MDLFPYIKVLFSTSNAWGEVDDKIKEKHFFMLNRIMAIKFPCLVDSMQDLNTNKIDASNFWHQHMIQIYKGKTPQWVYTKYKSNTATTKSVISESRLKVYADYHRYDIRDVKFVYATNPEELTKCIKRFEKLMS